MSAPEERSGRDGRPKVRIRDRRVTKGTRADRKASVEGVGESRPTNAVQSSAGAPDPRTPNARSDNDIDGESCQNPRAPVSAPEQEGPDVGSPEDLEGWAEWVEGVRGTEPAELFAECSRAMMTAASRLRAALDERSEREEAETCARSPGGDE